MILEPILSAERKWVINWGCSLTYSQEELESIPAHSAPMQGQVAESKSPPPPPLLHRPFSISPSPSLLDHLLSAVGRALAAWKYQLIPSRGGNGSYATERSSEKSVRDQTPPSLPSFPHSFSHLILFPLYYYPLVSLVGWWEGGLPHHIFKITRWNVVLLVAKFLVSFVLFCI